ncbi:MAG: glycosyltransferase family 39 protein [Gemmatimonadaceae bacterium]
MRVSRVAAITVVVAMAVSAAILLLPDELLRDLLTTIDPDRTAHAPTPRRIFLFRVAAIVAAFSVAAAVIFFRRATTLRRAIREDFASWRAQFRADWNLSRRAWAVLLLWVGVGVTVRLLRSLEPMEEDEAITYVRFASRSFLDIASDYREPNNHVLHTLFARASALLFGVSEAVVRLPALIAGILMIPSTFWFTKRLSDDEATSALAAGLIAVAPAFVGYSAAARGYTLLALLMLLGAVSGTRLRQQRSLVDWIVFVVAFALAFYAIPIAVYPAGIVSVWMLITSTRGRRPALLKELTVAAAAIGILGVVLYSPIIARSGLDALIGNKYVAPHALSELPRRMIGEWRLALDCWTFALPLPLLLVAAGGLVAASLFAAPGGSRPAALLAGVFVWMLPLSLVQRVAPPARTLNFLLPFVLIVASSGLGILALKASKQPSSRMRGWWALFAVAAPLSYIFAQVTTATNSSPWYLQRSAPRACAPRGILPAPAAAEILAGRLGGDTIAVAHHFSGLVAVTQFYLLSKGHSPKFVDFYRPPLGLKQIEPFSVVYILTRDGPEARDRHDPVSALTTNPQDFDALFEAPQLLADFGTATLYRASRKHVLAPEER